MRILGDEGTFIDLSVASEMTKNYRVSNVENHVIGHLFGKEKIIELLDQDECVGVRIYHGFDEMGDRALVLVGVTEDGNDICGGLILDRSLNCPTNCSSRNDLNC